MRVEVPTTFERFGAVRVHETVEVWELDSGLDLGSAEFDLGWQKVRLLPFDAINGIEQRMAIVVPCKSERLKILQGVLSGVPHDCLIILVSNSPRRPVDRFQMELEMVSTFCRLSQRSAIVVHQRDPGLGMAFAEAGLPELVDDQGKVRDGKGEGMIVGMALAKLSGKDFVGFVDADNYVPGAIYEYVKSYAAGFALSNTPYSMVRISWRSKPKIQEGELFFNRWGRTSQVTNNFLNLLLSYYTGFGSEIITTGNAGEHAISMNLATLMQFGSGFSVEPYEYLNLFELFGGVTESPHAKVMRKGVEVFQMETRNPHFHEDKGTSHVQAMRLQALNTLYHSPVCPKQLREDIIQFLVEEHQLDRDAEPALEVTYPPLHRIKWDRFLTILAAEAKAFEQTEFIESAQVVTRAPIVLPEQATEPISGPDGDPDEAATESAQT